MCSGGGRGGSDDDGGRGALVSDLSGKGTLCSSTWSSSTFIRKNKFRKSSNKWTKFFSNDFYDPLKQSSFLWDFLKDSQVDVSFCRKSSLFP